ncbi:MAG: GGDEF domain-containing phosphodiesterase [Gammaproteobacteria bacterium]
MPCNSAGLSVAGALLDLSVTPMRLQERELSVTCSIGMASVTGHAQSLDGLLKHADTALRDVMLAGGSSYLVYNDAMDNEAEQMLSIENDLRLAIQRNELELFYQPKIDPLDSRVACAEALLRWRKQGELVSPGVFIPIAEQTALIIPIGEWVLRTACEQWKQWSEDGLSCVPIAVNISAQQFRLADFPAQVQAILDSAGMPPQMLELEITEEAATGDQQQVIATMHALKGIGVTLAIDDFGTGYSSLSYLKHFPLDVLKVDQSFIREMLCSQDDQAIVEMIVSLAHRLAFKVVAEGVETVEQQRFLEALGCDLLQGFLFSRPLPANDFMQLLDVENANHKSPA